MEENKNITPRPGGFAPRGNFGPKKFGSEDRPRGPKREGGGGRGKGGVDVLKNQKQNLNKK